MSCLFLEVSFNYFYYGCVKIELMNSFVLTLISNATDSLAVMYVSKSDCNDSIHAIVVFRL